MATSVIVANPVIVSETFLFYTYPNFNQKSETEYSFKYSFKNILSVVLSKCTEIQSGEL